MHIYICNFGSFGACFIPVLFQELLSYELAMWLLYSVNLMNFHANIGVMTIVLIFLMPRVPLYFGQLINLSLGFYG